MVYVKVIHLYLVFSAVWGVQCDGSVSVLNIGTISVLHTSQYSIHHPLSVPSSLFLHRLHAVKWNVTQTDECVRMGKEKVAAYFKVDSRHLSAGTEVNNRSRESNFCRRGNRWNHRTIASKVHIASSCMQPTLKLGHCKIQKASVKRGTSKERTF